MHREHGWNVGWKGNDVEIGKKYEIDRLAHMPVERGVLEQSRAEVQEFVWVINVNMFPSVISTESGLTAGRVERSLDSAIASLGMTTISARQQDILVFFIDLKKRLQKLGRVFSHTALLWAV